MKITIQINEVNLTLEVADNLQFIDLLEIIFNQCMQQKICNPATDDLPMIFRLSEDVEDTKDRKSNCKKLSQTMFGQTLQEIGIREKDIFHTYSNKLTKYNFQRNLSWVAVMHYITQPQTLRLDMAKRLLKIIGSGFDSCGNTLLHYLARAGQITRELLGKYKHLINKQNESLFGAEGFQMTALHITAHYGHEDSMLMLIQHQANIHQKNHVGKTALYIAANKGSAAMTKILLDHGALANETTILKDTPLHSVFENKSWLSTNDLAVIQSLLEHHADVNAENMKGETPLALLTSLRGENKQIRHISDEIQEKILIEFIYAGANIHAQDKYGATLLQRALESKKHGYCPSILMIAGADCNIQIGTDDKKSSHILDLNILDPHRAQGMIRLAKRSGTKLKVKTPRLHGLSCYLADIRQSLIVTLCLMHARKLPTVIIGLVIFFTYGEKMSEPRILPIAEQRRKELFMPLFRETERELQLPELKENDPKIQFIQNKLMATAILTPQGIKDFLRLYLAKEKLSCDAQKLADLVMIENYFSVEIKSITQGSHQDNNQNFLIKDVRRTLATALPPDLLSSEKTLAAPHPKLMPPSDILPSGKLPKTTTAINTDDKKSNDSNTREKSTLGNLNSFFENYHAKKDTEKDEDDASLSSDDSCLSMDGNGSSSEDKETHYLPP